MKKSIFLLPLLLLFVLPILQAQNISQFNFNFNNSINIPEGLKIPAQILFGINTEITVQVFIVLICVWIILWILLYKIVQFLPFNKNFFVDLLMSLVITCLAAISGAVRSISIFFLSLGNIFGILERWPAISIILAIAIAAGLFYGLSILIKFLKEKRALGKAEKAGKNVKIMNTEAKVIAEEFEDDGIERGYD